MSIVTEAKALKDYFEKVAVKDNFGLNEGHLEIDPVYYEELIVYYELIKQRKKINFDEHT